MKPKQFYFILLIILGLILLLGASGFVWGNKQINNKLKAYRIELAKVYTADETLDNLAKLNSQYEKISPLVTKLYAVLPNKKQQSEILVQLQQIAQSSGLILSNINFLSSSAGPSDTSQTVKNNGFLAMPVNLKVSGSYGQLQNFLQQTENLNRYNSISTMLIVRNEDRFSTLTVNMTINAFLKQ